MHVATEELDLATVAAEPSRRSRAPFDPVLTVVVPTRNESGNVGPLVEQLGAVMRESDVEIIFVDDSDDGTDAVVRRLAPMQHRAIGLIHREPGERDGGLGGAVLTGIHCARADWVCVMDGDLQHPPAVVEELFERAGQGDVDLVVASRRCAGGREDEFGRFRHFVSRATTKAAEWLFGDQLRGISDPMSGFFMVRRSALDLATLHPHGFKILLEIAVRSHGLRTADVPFSFGVRHSGESKASALEAERYIHELLSLRFRESSARFGRFGVVGATGLVVNTLLLVLFADVIGVWYVLGAILATQGSTLWNFVLTDRWVFARGERRLGPVARALAFFTMNNAALLVRVPLLYALVTGLGVNHVIANVGTLLALSLVRFGVSDKYIWADARATAQLFNYDIHGIITIASEGRLPELERFRADGEIADPTIRVRIGRLSSRGVGAEVIDAHRTKVHYVERFGNLGFGAEFELGERVDILASPLLRHSPHVLYTNVVEPVLRWTFAERGYALVHAACIAAGEHAFLITARTDTGKTTTALKTLDQLPFSFLSDDLTLLAPDGRVLAYPKPLTISRHTLSAVRRPLLSRRERTGLILQSRLHSKSGRLFGLILAKTGLPAATFNAIVQLLVPPPKFQVDRLIPDVAIAPEAQLAGLAIIQREGAEGAETLSGAEALKILLSNCEDAYGFPPYPLIQQWLHTRNGLDLRARECEIVSRALAGKPAQLLCSYEREWHRMFPAMIADAVGLETAGRFASALAVASAAKAAA